MSSSGSCGRSKTQCKSCQQNQDGWCTWCKRSVDELYKQWEKNVKARERRKLKKRKYVIFEDGSKSMGDWTLNELFDKMCVEMDLHGKESVIGLFKKRCPVTGEIRGMKVELMKNE